MMFIFYSFDAFRFPVCTAAVRNCLECRYRQQQQLMLGSRRSSRQNNEERPDPIQALIAGVQALSKVTLMVMVIVMLMMMLMMMMMMMMMMITVVVVVVMVVMTCSFQLLFEQASCFICHCCSSCNNLNHHRRHHHHHHHHRYHPQQSILEKSAPAIINPIRDPEKLLQDMDINRLRAVVYRDVVSVFLVSWLGHLVMMMMTT